MTRPPGPAWGEIGERGPNCHFSCHCPSFACPFLEKMTGIHTGHPQLLMAPTGLWGNTAR